MYVFECFEWDFKFWAIVWLISHGQHTVPKIRRAWGYWTAYLYWLSNTTHLTFELNVKPPDPLTKRHPGWVISFLFFMWKVSHSFHNPFVLQKPERDEWGSGTEALECALQLEKSVNQSLLDLHKLCSDHNDPHVSIERSRRKAPPNI